MFVTIYSLFMKLAEGRLKCRQVGKSSLVRYSMILHLACSNVMNLYLMKFSSAYIHIKQATFKSNEKVSCEHFKYPTTHPKRVLPLPFPIVSMIPLPTVVCIGLKYLQVNNF